MHLDLNLRPPADVAADIVQLTAGLTQFWPTEQPYQTVADERILGTRFQDGATLHPQAVGRIVAQAAKQEPNMHGWGGKKVRDAETWDSPEMQLLTRRALLFCCLSQKATAAHVVDRWANVMEQGDYGRPHCHYESDVAVVYALDDGSAASDGTYSGRLEIIDSRIPFCCPSRPGRPTRGLLPEMTPGTMLLFPAEFLHYVKPYYGRQPRVTLAWNLSVGLPPESGVRDFTQQVAGISKRIE